MHSNQYSIKPIYLWAIFLLVSTISWLYQKYDLFFISAILSFFFGLITLLESKTEQILKGVYLISAGAGSGIMIQSLASQELMDSYPKTIMQLGILKDIVIYSFSGAGGSILATYADKYRHETEKVAPPCQRQDSLVINTLRKDIRSLRKNIFYLFFFIAITLTTLIAVTLVK